MIDLGDRDWVVGNYDDVYYGNVDLEKATIESDNSVYAQLTQLVGSKKVAETAKRMGIRSKLDGYYAIGLGAEAVNPLELARAYATLAHGGRRADGAIFGNRPRVIDEVTEDGRKRHNTPRGIQRADRDAGRSCQLDPAEGRPLRHRQACLHAKPARGRKNRDNGELWRRLVRRLHAAARGCRLGRLPDDPEADADRVPRRCRHRRQLPGPDLEVVHGESAQERGAQGFPAPPTPYVAPKLVVRRGDRLMLDNGLCLSRKEVVYFAGAGPTKSANCLENEVQVPDVRKLTLAEAEARVEAQPLTPTMVYKPATPLQRPGIVVDQEPRRGYRSSYDRIILIVTKATQGVIPDLVGQDIDDARLRLKRLKLKPRILWVEGATAGRCSSKGRAPDLRRRPASTSSWWSRAHARPQRPAEPARTSLRVTPRTFGRDTDPDPCAHGDLRAAALRDELERRHVHREPVVLPGDPERLAQASRACGEQPLIVEPAAVAHQSVPLVGSSARISTAAGLPSSSQTRFRHQWIP